MRTGNGYHVCAWMTADSVTESGALSIGSKSSQATRPWIALWRAGSLSGS